MVSRSAALIRQSISPAASFLALMLVVSFFSPRVLPYVMGVAGALAIARSVLTNGGNVRAYIPSPQLIFLLLFLFWAATSLAWARFFDLSFERLVKIAPLIPLCWAAVSRTAFRSEPNAALWVLGGFLVMFLLLVFDILAGFPITQAAHPDPNKEPIYYLNKNAVILCLIAWPLAWLFWHRNQKLVACGTLGISLVTVLFMESQAAQLAGFCLLASAPLAVSLGRKWFRVVASIGIFAVMIATPFALAGVYEWASTNLEDSPALSSASVLQRLEAWALLGNYIQERPFVGHGLEATRELAFPDNRAFIGETSDSILHPHNFVVQIWLELGFVGTLLAAMTITSLLQAVAQRPTHERILLFPVLVATLAVMYVGWGLWQGWWIGFVAMVAFLCRAVIANVPAGGTKGPAPASP